MFGSTETGGFVMVVITGQKVVGPDPEPVYGSAEAGNQEGVDGTGDADTGNSLKL
jgi:hypothetical protein